MTERPRLSDDFDLDDAICRTQMGGTVSVPVSLLVELRARRAAQFTDDGQWICDACGFRLTRALLRATDGAVGVDRSTRGELCPNDATPLRRLTWKEDAENANRVGLELSRRITALEQELAERQVGK